MSRFCITQLVVMLGVAVVSKATREDRPNVIFAMADDLGWGDVQYNNGKAATPNLNKMARSPQYHTPTAILQWWSSMFTY